MKIGKNLDASLVLSKGILAHEKLILCLEGPVSLRISNAFIDGYTFNRGLLEHLLCAELSKEN